MDSFQTLKKPKAYVLLQVCEEVSNGCTQFEDIGVFFLAYEVINLEFMLMNIFHLD